MAHSPQLLRGLWVCKDTMALDPAQQADFDRSLAFVLKQEGGFSDDPTDHGGRTYEGIEETEYNAWRHGQGLEGDIDVRDMTEEQAKAIYIEKYWLPAHCGLTHWPGSVALFDSVVNCGLQGGTKFLQRALKLPDDGVMGPHTMAALSLADPEELRDSICDQRKAFYQELAKKPGQDVFLHGWLNRVTALRLLK